MQCGSRLNPMRLKKKKTFLLLLLVMIAALFMQSWQHYLSQWFFAHYFAMATPLGAVHQFHG